MLDEFNRILRRLSLKYGFSFALISDLLLSEDIE